MSVFIANSYLYITTLTFSIDWICEMCYKYCVTCTALYTHATRNIYLCYYYVLWYVSNEQQVVAKYDKI